MSNGHDEMAAAPDQRHGWPDKIADRMLRLGRE
jgi:hypothetical protein